MSFPGGEGEFVGLGIQDARAAVGAADGAFFLQGAEVAPDGGNGGVHLVGKLLEGGKFRFQQVFFNPLLAFFRLHRDSSVVDFGRFCKNYVDYLSRMSENIHI